jgi:predicted TIM-barrel fold metal-dependent hydrolase
VLKLAREHPEFLPAVSIHPARPDALEELERCLAGGAVMMKCLQTVTTSTVTSADTRFWERMAEAGLPLLAHTGGEHTVEVVRRELADPRTLELPLDCGVRVIAAHCGTKSGLLDPEYFHIFVRMTTRYPHLYGDTSAFNVPIRGRHSHKCLRAPLVHRLLHGSDYPVPVHGHYAWLRGYVDWSSFQRWESSSNCLERDYQLKKAMGFPEETFTRIYNLLPVRDCAASPVSKNKPGCLVRG